MNNKNFLNYLNNSQQNKGFGILEVVLASGIIVIFAASVALLSNIIVRTALINKHRTQAAYLAQEAMEGIKNIRNTNWVDQNSSTQWKNGFIENVAVKINIDSTDNSYKIQQGTDYFSEQLGLVAQNDRFFTRSIYIYPNQDDPQNTVDIEVYIVWQDYGKDRTTAVFTNLTNWKTQ